MKPKLPVIIQHYELRNPVFHLPAIKHKFAEKLLQYCLIKHINEKHCFSMMSDKVQRTSLLLHKLKYVFPSYILRMIYNSLILPHYNYSLLAWGCKCQNIEILQKKTIRIVHFKSLIAHTEQF